MKLDVFLKNSTEYFLTSLVCLVLGFGLASEVYSSEVKSQMMLVVLIVALIACFSVAVLMLFAVRYAFLRLKKRMGVLSQLAKIDGQNTESYWNKVAFEELCTLEIDVAPVLEVMKELSLLMPWTTTMHTCRRDIKRQKNHFLICQLAIPQ